jgi:hypothetical protein
LLVRPQLQSDIVEAEASDCHNVVKGSADDELCYLRVDWVMREGIARHPDWYDGLSKDADFLQVQQHVSEEDNSPCPRPCGAEQRGGKSLAKAEKMGKGDLESSPEFTREQAKGESCSNGWTIAKGCLEEFEYNGKTYKGCTTEDSVKSYANQAWCSNEPVYTSLWSLCTPCDQADTTGSLAGTATETAAPTKATTAVSTSPGTAPETDATNATTQDEDCHTVQKTEEKDKDCYDRVVWVRAMGIQQHPEFYEGLDEKSSFEEVQDFVHKEDVVVCPKTCKPYENEKEGERQSEKRAKAPRPANESSKAPAALDGKAKSTSNTSSGSCPVCAPEHPVAPDVVIPFFERDLCKLKYTAKSFASNDPHKRLGDVFLMWVSDKPSTNYQGDLDAIIASIKVSRNVHFNDFSGALHASGISGWFGQQVLKLKIANNVMSDFYMVLDAKNTLIREVEQDSFFNQCNQAKIQAEFHYNDIPKPHSDWYQRSAEALGLDKPSAGYWPASITPMVMHKGTVLDMLRTIGEAPEPENICSGPLCDLMGAYSESGHGATEFTMYTLWAHQKTNLECAHTVEVVPHFKVKYSSTWQDELDSHLKRIHFDTPDEQKQITVSSKDGYPFDWSPHHGHNPKKEKFPLKFEDLTKKWATSLWRGVPENAHLLEAVNLWTIRCLLEGKQQFPLMFGAQPEALSTLSKDKRKKAIADLAAIYSKAKLHDPANESDDDLVACVVGWHN